MNRLPFLPLVSLMMIGTIPTALANDGAFGGLGVHPMPLDNTEIRMVDEIVTLRLDPKIEAWDARASFVFENTAHEPVTVTIGFPFPVVDPNTELVVPKGVTPPKANDPLVWAFKTQVRGEKVNARRGQVIANPEKPGLDYTFAYLFDVTFAPGERVHIENAYRHGVSTVVGGLKYANYVVRSGTTWKGGNIGHARLNVEVTTDRWVPCPPSESGERGFARPDGAAVSPLHGEPGFVVHWSLADFAPTEDVQVCFVDLDVYRQMRLYSDLAEREIGALDTAALRTLRDEVFALRGHVFLDHDLRDHFNAQWWYRPDPTFRPKEFSDDEKLLVESIRERLKLLAARE
ncbi:MAG: YARHG domain-containing protein [Deltaproteobacteria bacterium]|nr:MAG: YARHG domain-containing protein [Deltaproteobacteria bacterium]